MAERRYAVRILQDHGVSAAKLMTVGRRANFERKLSSHLVDNVNDMINDYKLELEGYRIRLLELEEVELQRMAGEQAYKEELANNHGKPLTYFKVPQLSTRTRSNTKRFRKIEGEVNDDAQNLSKIQREQAASIGRHSRFALKSEHFKLKELIEKREKELKELLSQAKDDPNFHKIEGAGDRLKSTRALQQANRRKSRRISMVRGFLAPIKQESEDGEITIDLSVIKQGRKSRLQKSPASKGSRSNKSVAKTKAGSSSGKAPSCSSRKSNSSRGQSRQSFAAKLAEFHENMSRCSFDSSCESKTDKDDSGKRQSAAPQIAIDDFAPAVAQFKVEEFESAPKVTLTEMTPRKSFLVAKIAPVSPSSAHSAQSAQKPELSPLQNTAKYESKRRNSAQKPQGFVLKKNQITKA